MLPTHYQPQTVGDLWIERTDLVTREADRWRQSRQVRPAREDSFRVAAFGIDCQVGFCTPGASLYVPGAVDDIRRSVEWIYRNLEGLTSLVLSLDTHSVFQIFHPAWWTDVEGRHPEPFTVISADDVRSRRWAPRQDAAACLEYCERLAASGRYVLTIWPYHTLMGGLSHALVPAVMEAALTHAIVRDEPTRLHTKGTHALTESYSVMSPEVRELGGQSVGAFDEGLFETLMSHDRVYVFGEAKSHCVLSTLMDLRRRIDLVDPALMGRIHILVDAMSPVGPPPLDPLPPELDFPRVAEQAFAELERVGMRLVRTTAPILEVEHRP